MIEILLPWWNAPDRKFDGPIRAWIVPDLAPHLNGTFAVHRFPPENPWRNNYSVTHVETGCAAGPRRVGKEAAIEAARDLCAGKTDAELQRAVRKIRRLQKGQ